jgi:hypothetical protein
MSGHNGEVYYRGMTESDWKRLHTRVIPNPVPLEEFKDVVLAGKLQDRYLAKDLHKMMQELRDLLREHGELREAAIFPLSGRKQELAQAAAAAVRVIDAHRDRLPALRRSPGCSVNATAAATTGASPSDAVVAPEARDGSTSPTLDSASDQPQRLSASGRSSGEAPPQLSSSIRVNLLLPSSATPTATPATSPRRSSRILPLVDHIASEEQPLLSSASTTMEGATLRSAPLTSYHHTVRVREPAVSRGGSADRSSGHAERPAKDAPPRLATSWTTNERLSSTIAQHAAAAAPTPTTAGLSSAWPHATTAGNTAPTSTTSSAATLSAGAVSELAQLNEASPPFFSVLNVARRFQLRFGSSPLKFEIPVQYTEAVNSRRLRVYIIPLRHPNIPARWPTAKEIVVYVNEQCVMTPWKRSWPERKQEVAKTFLPLDITYLLSRNVASQRMQVDVFNKEYLSPAIVAVVQPRSLGEVTEAMLLSRLGCRSVPQVRQAFERLAKSFSAVEATVAPTATTSPLDPLQANNAAVWQTYASILDEDEEEDGLEADDPVITTKCPISQLPLGVPVRGRLCTHLQCVDLDAFLVSSHKGAFWNCALCDAEMRPQDVQIDTVLWSYLNSFASSDVFPAYLRLSARPSHVGNAAAGKYYWHPSTRTGEDADVVTDGDESGDDEHEHASSDDGGNGSTLRGVREDSGLPQPLMAPSPNHVLYTRSASSLQDSAGSSTPTSPPKASWTAGSAPAAAEGERKRGREEGVGEPQGTADDPIEL